MMAGLVFLAVIFVVGIIANNDDLYKVIKKEKK